MMWNASIGSASTPYQEQEFRSPTSNALQNAGQVAPDLRIKTDLEDRQRDFDLALERIVEGQAAVLASESAGDCAIAPVGWRKEVRRSHVLDDIGKFVRGNRAS